MSRRTKKNGTAILIGILLGVLAYSRYLAGDVQTAQVVALFAVVAVILGIRD